MDNKILLTHEFGNNIFTRSSISDFFRKLNSLKNKEIILDFDKVEFISRSCADEYLKQKKLSTKKIVEANMSNEVYNMFKNVYIQYENVGLEVPFKVNRQRKVIA